MADSILIFDMTDPVTGDADVRRFKAESVAPDAFLLGIANGDGAFFDYIAESSEALGEISQRGTEDSDGIRWTLTSRRVEDIDRFVDEVLACMFALFGWTLVELQ